MSVEQQALEANSQDHWNRLWKDEGHNSWRKTALAPIYERIEFLLGFEDIPEKSRVIDVGGGVGILASHLNKTTGRSVAVWDHSDAALEQVPDGIETHQLDLESQYKLPPLEPGTVAIGTEILEHLSPAARDELLTHIVSSGCTGMFSVPNNLLGPDEEPQHTIKFTPLEFKQHLATYFEHVRVEVIGPYLLAICGFDKGYTLTVTMPARDEAADLDKTLASFMGIADEMVIGIDPRTEDNSAEVAARYAEVVFELEDPSKDMPEGGVNFAWIRNQCMDRCSGDWIFMSEAHELLHQGQDVLLALVRKDLLPPGAKVGYVMRTGNGQQWGFPWLCKNESQFRYERAVHNFLAYPEGTRCVKFPQIVTLHERAEERAQARVDQRKIQNRTSLMEDWVINRNENSLFYLGQELRGEDEPRGVKSLEKFLVMSNNGPSRYQARLMLAKLYARQNDQKKAWDVLIKATADDWSRTEHWLWLGDIAFGNEQYDQALQFYRYVSTTIGDPPFTIWWIDLSMYGFLAAQRLAMIHSELGRYSDSLYWAERVLELLPDDSPEEARDEARENIASLKEELGNDQLS